MFYCLLEDKPGSAMGTEETPGATLDFVLHYPTAFQWLHLVPGLVAQCHVTNKGKTRHLWCFLTRSCSGDSLVSHSAAGFWGNQNFSWTQNYYIQVKNSSQCNLESVQGGSGISIHGNTKKNLDKALSNGISKLALHWAGDKTQWSPRVHPSLCNSRSWVLQTLELQRNLRWVREGNYTEGVSPDSSGVPLYTKMT